MGAPPVKKTAERFDQTAFLVAARALVTEGGFAALTLRPLAARLDVSVTVLSNQFGARDEVVAAIIHAAEAEDAAYLASWRARVERIDHLTPSGAACLVEAILEDMAGPRRDASLLFLEMVQAAYADATVQAAMGSWLFQRETFWAEIAAKARMPAALIETGLLAGYTVDELAFSLALPDWPAYRLLRKLGLNRLFGGYRQRPGEDWDAQLFQALFDELEYDPSDLSVVHGAPIEGDWRGKAAYAAAKLLTTGGVRAVTHRAVAAEAEIKPTTLAYRFPTQEDLVIGGLEYIISRFAGVAPMDFDDSNWQDGLGVGRATFAVALAAVRAPRLAPCAADMRRRRGTNFARLAPTYGLRHEAFDDLGAQALSVGLTGLSHAAVVGSNFTPERIQRALQAAVDWAHEPAEGVAASTP